MAQYLDDLTLPCLTIRWPNSSACNPQMSVYNSGGYLHADT